MMTIVRGVITMRNGEFCFESKIDGDYFCIPLSHETILENSDIHALVRRGLPRLMHEAVLADRVSSPADYEFLIEMATEIGLTGQLLTGVKIRLQDVRPPA